MKRVFAWTLCALSACGGNQVDFTIDASALAELEPQGLLYVDVVAFGETVDYIEIDVMSDPIVSRPELLKVGGLYGVAAYLDLDGDAACASHPVDLPWLFTYSPGVGIDFTWVPDPAESPISAGACSRFDVAPADTDPSDTDAPDTDPSDTDAPDTDPSDTDAPDTDPSDTDAPDTDPSDTDD
jgi:hypothetical protein